MQFTKTDILNALDLKTREFVADIILLDAVTSTNDYLLNLAKTGKIKPGTICIAKQQTAGRGRHGKTWVSHLGNLYLSIFVQINKPVIELGNLSVEIGKSIVEALKAYGIKEGLEIKWPNDILWHKRKLAGILIETFARVPNHANIIIGVGINIKLEPASIANIPQAVTDLSSILEKISYSKLLAVILEKIFNNIIKRYT